MRLRFISPSLQKAAAVNVAKPACAPPRSCSVDQRSNDTAATSEGAMARPNFTSRRTYVTDCWGTHDREEIEGLAAFRFSDCRWRSPPSRHGSYGSSSNDEIA